MTVKSADKKPEKYVGPDGKARIRMVPVDKEVVKSEAKDGDGVNIVKDRPFKGKPMDRKPGKVGIKFSDMRKSKWAKDADANPKRAKAMDEGYSPDLDPDVQKNKRITKSDKDKLAKLSNLMKKANEAKDPEEYDKEGDMAKTQLKTMIDAAQELHDQLSDDENMPEWVQNKITKATDYIDSVRDYMKNNDDVNEETVDEISKGLAGRYIKKAQVSTADAAKSNERGHTDSRSPDRDIAKAGSNQAKKGIKTFINRNKGTSTAVDKLTGKARVPAKEDTVSEISNNKMGQYVRKAAGDAAAKGAAGDTDKAKARVKGVSKAMDKMDKNRLFGRQ